MHSLMNTLFREQLLKVYSCMLSLCDLFLSGGCLVCRSVPDEGSAIAASRAYATHPHIASSKEDLEDSRVILKLFQDQLNITVPSVEPLFSAGSEASRNATLNIATLKEPVAWIDTYYPFMNTPLDRSLTILDADNTVVWNADLVEDGNPLDPDAAKYRDFIPTFHGLSKNGSAEGQLIYANYGRKEDYDELEAKGVSLEGKIVLTRYNAIFRGLKVHPTALGDELVLKTSSLDQRCTGTWCCSCAHL
jgi:N-acetylated-alpha-linked acidic dipeptidase